MDIIQKYFPEFSESQLQKLQYFHDLLYEWNQKINLVSRKDTDHLVERHILHSLAIYDFIQFDNEQLILDVGTGGGLPGIPLAIANPEASFVLADSIEKKTRAVAHMADKLELHNVKVIRNRAEKLNMKFDFIVSRAVTNFPKFVQLTKKKINKQQKHEFMNGILYLKGGDFAEEISDFDEAETIPVSEFFEEPFFETKKIIYLPLVF